MANDKHVKTVTLNNGIKMPILGFGVYQVTDQKLCEESVLEAINTGYRLIDTAALYLNEEAVGRAIKRSGIARDELFITSKLWVQDAGYDNTKKALERSLKKLQLDYLDLYLIHQPYGDIFGSWKAMNEMLKEGKLRAIGVSNFESDRVMDLIANTEIVPAINQVETHPFQQQSELHEFLKGNGVQMEAWAPFAEGRNGIFTNEVLNSIAKEHSKSVAQVILKWLVQGDIVAIPKSVHKDRIAENFNIFDFDLSKDEMASMAALDTRRSLFFDHRDPEAVKRISERKFDF